MTGPAHPPAGRRVTVAGATLRLTGGGDLAGALALLGRARVEAALAEGVAAAARRDGAAGLTAAEARAAARATLDRLIREAQGGRP
jgi:hypothetical protein